MNMANERAEGQKLIPVPASDDFIEELNKGFKLAGYSNRSQFIRDAIIEKLKGLGVKVPPALANPPDRLRKGGPLKYNITRANHMEMNEPTNSKSSLADLKRQARKRSGNKP